mmetsp:Transcript_2604/g.3894  ORF Transcript_2604/g.3894 Transcript_2604/m.3894 type:complete len:157 (+) Transcript_2604:295-765(+)
MPMGALNAHAIFCMIMDHIRRETNLLASKMGIMDDVDMTLHGEKPWTNAEIIVDDAILHSEEDQNLIKYFIIFLDLCIKCRVTINLKKTRFFPTTAKFVGRDVEADGNKPAQSKLQALDKLRASPHGVGDLRGIIGMLGFYSEFLPYLELKIAPWC